MIRKIRIVSWVLIASTFVGCTAAKQQAYPNTNRSHLWTAMVATATSPEYSSTEILNRWIVVENNVETDSDQAQIDVQRIIARTVRLPRQKKQIDRREVLFSVYLLPTDIPTINFISHSSSMVPVRGTQEAARFFAAVEAMLVPIK